MSTVPRDRLAILHSSGATALGDDPFGKDVANLQLWQAPAEAGTLFRGQPYLADLAWMRRRTASDRTYSLVGLIHSMAPPGVREMIAASATAPTHPWDALICTSPSVQVGMEVMFDEWAGHLVERMGGRPPPRPDLPLIPLGIHGDDLAAQADRPGARDRTRTKFELPDDGILVIWVGRLSYFEKAFPQPMFKALQIAAAATGVKVTFVMAGWFPEPGHREHYEAAARLHAPDVDVRLMDGNDKALLADLWAAADVFLSLVENIQETFGLTPAGGDGRRGAGGGQPLGRLSLYNAGRHRGVSDPDAGGPCGRPLPGFYTLCHPCAYGGYAAETRPGR